LTAGTAPAAEVEVMHWWTSGGEQAAVSVFAREFEKAGDAWKDTAVAGGPNARAAMMQRTLGGDPPGASQFNPGRQYEELITAGLLLDLTELAEKEGWAGFINPPNILDPCVKDGKVWCVPVNIHSWQWAWASIPVFEKAGVPLPKNLDEFLASAPKIKEAGFIPFAIGGETWQHTGALNVVLLSQVGAEGWNRLYQPHHHRQGRRPDHGRLGARRVRHRQRGPGQRLCLHSRPVREPAARHRRRHLPVPEAG
jgi:glucose/mannose transport system substrate-binding protein